MAFEKMEVQAFLDELASNSPAPGGGSVAALGGSLAAGLVSMVCNLTIGKEKYKDNWAVMEGIVAKSEDLRAKCTKLMNEDTESFNTFMAAIKMPKDTDEQKQARKKAMAEAAKITTEVPLRTLETCSIISGLALTAAKHGNPNTISDAGSAALLAEAAGKAAAFNVRVNLPGVKDEAFASGCKERMRKALDVIASNSRDTGYLLDRQLS